ncbi:hypothetical protein AB0K51_09715 [Kitasatospora sp. NPDC049285]|uniref:hypothetical protein n=1 Tax=Kitasatospora sp. NPDC049285 TaxID=3157096 RepID=UPI0034429F74
MSGRRSAVQRAARTVGVLALVMAAAGGAALSADPGGPPARVADAHDATTEIPVDPLTGAPTGIDPTHSATKRAPQGTGSAAAAKPQAAGATGDAVTVTGSGEFANLKVTVSQTTHLVNQVVTVGWTGGKPTVPSPMVFGQDYLTLMQCWGDGAGPDRSQCQYGATKGDSRGGAYVPSRQLNYGILKDGRENLPDRTDNQNTYVPFRSVTGDPEETQGSSQFYDVQSTNEVPFAPTRADGTGQVFFEVQTGMEAPGLGCGQTPKGQPGPFTEGRQCWLVVVPRGELEVDDKPPVGSSGQLQSSPLSRTNWDKRLVVPLHFEPVGLSCPIGSTERPTAGTEVAAEAVWRWQPVLCQQAGGIFSYTQITDDLARSRLTRGDPGLIFVGSPLPKAEQVEGRTPVYAPLAVSGLAISFNIESQSYSRTPPEIRQKDGQRITDLKLTPRLVAKLLSQSYRYSVNPGDPDIPPGNPLDLTSDPEFIELNPQFSTLYFPSRIADVLLPSGEGDAARLLWLWVLADADARAFLNGQPDAKWHHQVNPHFTLAQVEMPRSNYPKPDGYCQAFPDDPFNRPEWCNLDGHPYASNMREGSRATARGDTLAKSVWDATALPPSLKKAAPQAQGLRGILAVTTTAQAARYGLNTAQLRNANGEFVAPTDQALLTEAAAAPAGEKVGAPVVDPAAKVAGGYPLTTITYAATVPSALDKESGKSYAALLRYAMGGGQVPGVAAGQLAAGYAQLPQTLRTQTLAVADAIEARAGVPEPTASATPTAAASSPATRSTTGTTTGSGSSGSAGGTGSTGAGHADNGGGAGGAQDPGTPPGPSPTPSHEPSMLSPAPSAAPVAKTAGTDVGALRYLLGGALLVGLLAAAAGVFGPRLLRALRR